MTREEAIIILDCERPYGNCGCGASIEEIEDALNMAIKALEQEAAFDEIRAEIKALNPEPTAYDVVDGNPIKDAVWEIIADVLQIIDKYRGESEDT